MGEDILVTPLDTLSITRDNSTLNPGFRHKFQTQIVVDLVNENITDIFKKWYYNQTTNNQMNVSLNWNVFDNDTNEEIIFNESLISTTEYISTSLTLNTENRLSKSTKTGSRTSSSGGTLTIDYFFTIYSTQSESRLSTHLCNVYDQTYFKSGKYYNFEIEIEFSYSYDQEGIESPIVARKQENRIMYANSPPQNGSCTTISQLPRAEWFRLIDDVNASCNQFEDDGDLEYNFIFDHFLFLKDNYNDKQTTDTIISIGNHTITGVAVDEYSLPGCINVAVGLITNVNENATWFDYTSDEFLGWVTSLYNDLTENSTLNSTSTSLLATSITWDIIVKYLNYHNPNEDTNYMEEEEIAAIQAWIIETTIETVSEKVKTIQDAAALTVVLAKITDPLIGASTGTVIRPVYAAGLISSVLQVIQDPILAVLKHGIISGQLISLDVELAQSVIGMLSTATRISKFVF